MFETLQQREDFTTSIFEFLKSRFDLSDTQVFIFGSFLTDDFIPGKSDIDIGIYSENREKALDIQYELDMYLKEKQIKHDIVDMELHDKLLINIPIMTYGKALTDYESEKMFKYLVEMIKKHGIKWYNLNS